MFKSQTWWVFHVVELLEEFPIVVDVEQHIIHLTSKLRRVVVVDLDEVLDGLQQEPEHGHPEICNLCSLVCGVTLQSAWVGSRFVQMSISGFVENGTTCLVCHAPGCPFSNTSSPQQRKQLPEVESKTAFSSSGFH